jgi:hypothetical protein
MFVRKRLPQLLRYPTTGRMPGNSNVQNAPAVMADDEKAIEHPKGDGWHGKEVHGGDGLAMVVKKRLPAACGLRIARCSPL